MSSFPPSQTGSSSPASPSLTGSCVIAQSGGPTAVVNASALGAIEASLAAPCVTRTLGAAHGIEGVLNGKLFDMGCEDRRELSLLRCTPAAALGSCRYKMSDPEEDAADYLRLLGVFRRYDVRYFFYIGGNDSMDTCRKISGFLADAGYDCRVVGIPKTIDNDLCGTDHCPGFGSAARFIATACMELDRDVRVYEKGRVTIVEIMGRHAGWLAGASALAAHAGGGPDLVYLPEVPFSMERFLADVAAVYRRRGSCMAAVSEGVRDADGRFVSEPPEGGRDVFGHAQLGGLAALLAEAVRRKTGFKVRGVELSLLQRCAAHAASGTDIGEAWDAGSFAVAQALAGASGKMVSFERGGTHGEYACRLTLVPLEAAANREKLVPRGWINAAGNNVERAFVDYALPLIQGDVRPPMENGLPRFARLRLLPAEPRG